MGAGGGAGVVVDEQVATFANHAEPTWTGRSGIDLSAFANQTVSLAFEVEAHNSVFLAASAAAWIDDIHIGPAGE